MDVSIEELRGVLDDLAANPDSVAVLTKVGLGLEPMRGRLEADISNGMRPVDAGIVRWLVVMYERVCNETREMMRRGR